MVKASIPYLSFSPKLLVVQGNRGWISTLLYSLSQGPTLPLSVFRRPQTGPVEVSSPIG